MARSKFSICYVAFLHSRGFISSFGIAGINYTTDINEAFKFESETITELDLLTNGAEPGYYEFRKVYFRK